MGTELVNDGYIGFVKHSAGWHCSFSEVSEWNGNGYLIEDMQADGAYLPTEFYAHQFLDVNPRDTASLLEFASRWGLPRHPCRNYLKRGWPVFSWWWGLSGYRFSDSPLTAGIPVGYVRTCEERRILAGIVATNAANGLSMELCPDGLKVPANEMDCPFITNSPLMGALLDTEYGELISFAGDRFISIAEASSVVEASQRAIRSLLAWVKSVLHGECELSDFYMGSGELWEAWSFAAYAAEANITPANCVNPCNGNIISAVFDQLQATFLSPEPWRICPECGKPFKRKQNSPGATPKTSKNPPRSKYCCEKCRNSHGNRRKGERIDHGI